MESKYTIHLSHEYSTTPQNIFNMFRDGLLFQLTGADKINFDFKEAGKFLLEFSDRGKVDGTFILIIPDKKIILNWNVTGFGKNPEVNTKVILSITGKDNTTLTIDHSGIKTKEATVAKEHGWMEILTDLENEISLNHRDTETQRF